ncbi:SDR family NAD(P)-dependent oxidoreductase [Acidovorax sp. D2M1]|uniref:SDR family NAD(P)-dependent oxidoreductase n=1 Tax=Acidovorax benzenivorans TaxID=2987520 RepID=A0ABT5RZ42_9BURK|nr:SDR family NAD(P)-dependent oxidoreductase [Acidovorax benzenivorans]MDD2178950.1 SDR family NAD(P)-dependent oxidoreductase [Acidovorax benzenivorans]
MSHARNPATTRQATPAGPLPRTIVTGASSGIGRALTLELARRGVPVLAVARHAEPLQALADAHGLIEPWVADLSRIEEIDDLAAQWLLHYPDIGALVNNAGIQHDLRVDDAGYRAQDMRAEVELNLLAPMVLTRALMPHLQAQQRAWVVNVGSVLGSCPKRTAAVYSATKAGLDLFTQGLRVQMQGSPVRAVHAVMPLVDTPMTQGRGRGKIPPNVAAQALVRGLIAGHTDIRIGKARTAWHLQRWAPGLLARMLRSA